MAERDQNPPINSTGAMSSVEQVRADLENIGFYEEHVYPANIGSVPDSSSRRPASQPTPPSLEPSKP